MTRFYLILIALGVLIVAYWVVSHSFLIVSTMTVLGGLGVVALIVMLIVVSLRKL